MFVYITIVMLVMAAVCGILGWFVLRERNRGFAKAMFYIFMLSAVVFLIFGVLQPPY